MAEIIIYFLNKKSHFLHKIIWICDWWVPGCSFGLSALHGCVLHGDLHFTILGEMFRTAQGFRLSLTVEAPEEVEGNLLLLPPSRGEGLVASLRAEPALLGPDVTPFPGLISLKRHPEFVTQPCVGEQHMSSPRDKALQTTKMASCCLLTPQRGEEAKREGRRNSSERQFSTSATHRKKTVTWRSSLLQQANCFQRCE